MVTAEFAEDIALAVARVAAGLKYGATSALMHQLENRAEVVIDLASPTNDRR